MVSPTRHGTTILDACGHSSTCSQACAQQCSTVTTRPHDVSDHGTAHGCTHPVVDTPATITSESSSSPDAQATTAAGASAGPPCAAELWQANGGSHASVAPLHKSISCRDPSTWYTNMLCLYCIATCTHRRITQEHDFTTPQGLEWAKEGVRQAKQQGCKLVIWASLPCTGGCPWWRVNVCT